MYWEKFKDKIINLQSDLSLFKAEFLDRDGFKRFVDNLVSEVGGCGEICITGYFSETIREALEIIITRKHIVKLICPEFPLQSKRDRMNLEALNKLALKGAKIKVNNRLHARFLVAHSPDLVEVTGEVRGLLVIGSFDFNTECIGRERYDAGIKTTHPDLIQSAVKLFDRIWEEPESESLYEKYPTGRRIGSV